MELDTFLHRVQSVLKNEQRLRGNLDTIKSDHEDAITKVLGSLKKITDEAEEIDKSKRKLYIILLLNTKTDMCNNLKKNRKYAHLIRFFPKLSPDLFMKIVISLELHQYLYESVAWFCPPLSYQVLDLCLNSLKWLDLFEAVSFVEHLITSLFHKIVLTDEKDNFNIHLTDMFQRLLLHYDAEKSGCIKRMNLWKSSKMKHYAGLVMASLLSLLEKCTKIYSKKTDDFRDNESLYNIEIDEDSIKLISKMIAESRPFSVQQCYEHIVSKCYENVCSITVNIWLFWVEIDLDDVPDTENTLQRLIGEKAYTCRETLKEAERAGVSSHESADLLLKLKSLALKPHTDEEDATLLNLSQILTNIQDTNKDTKKWIKFLINKPFAVEPLALEVTKNYLNIIEDVELEKLWKLIITFIKTNKESKLHKDFLLDMVKTLDIDCQMKLSKCYVENIGLSDILKTDEFQSEFVETFNKVVNEDDKEKELYRQFLRLALQSPDAVITRIVADGIISEVTGHLMADILGRLQPFCDAPHYGDSTLLSAALAKLLNDLPVLPEVQQANYPLFVRELVMRKCLDGELFIRTCIMLNIHKNLKTKNWTVLNACLDTLSELYDVNCVHNCPASLVMVLQVVQASRWAPSTYSMAAVRVCELALQLVDLFVTKWIEIGCEDKYQKNLSELVRERISPLNRFHLYRLLSKEKMPTDPALQLMYRMHYGISDWSVLQVSQDDRLKLVYALCYVLPVLTSQEWQELFCVAAPKCSEFLCLFHIVTDALLLCVDSAKVRASNDVMSCLGFAVLNVAQVIKYEVNRWTKDDNEYKISVLSKMCHLVAAFPVTQQEEFGLTLVKVLQQLLPEGSRRHPLSAEEMNEVTASLAVLQAVEVRQALSREFLEMVHR